MDFIKETIALNAEEDIVRVRKFVKDLSEKLRFKVIDQTKLITAVSEIARNTIIHGGGGIAVIEVINNNERVGIKLFFEDKGKGIEDVELAMKDGYTTGNGLGYGLGGSKRLVDEFYIESKPQDGTKVTMIKWK